ncbi:hypothetical protein [Arthrobacter sp. NPDC057013]|uniref:hypothetical protein n=1 Tax=Arthrobacter sp. NPDC057013 TaxID=3345999 RepID=UPI00363FD027
MAASFFIAMFPLVVVLMLHVFTYGVSIWLRRPEGQPAAESQALATQRRLVTDRGGTYHTVVGDDAAKSLLEFARSVNATQIVVGVSRGRVITRLPGSSVGSKVVRGSGDIDVHMVSHPLGGRVLPGPPSWALGRARATAGFILAALLPVLITTVMSLAPDRNFATHVLVHLTGVIPWLSRN